MREPDCLKHLLLGNIRRLAFNHCHRFFGAGDGKVETACFQFIICRIENELSVYETHAHRADRPMKWNMRNRKSRRRRVDREHI